MKNYGIIALLMLALSISACKKKNTDPSPEEPTNPTNPTNPTPPHVYEFTSITDLTGGARDLATAFTLNNIGYVGLGEQAYSSYYNDFYKYDPASNTWSTAPTFPGYARKNAFAFTLGDTAYVGGGYGYNGSNYVWFNDFYKIDIVNNTWIQLNNLPNTGYRTHTFVINNEGYALMNLSLYKYNPVSDSWENKGYHTGSNLAYGGTFTIGTKAYICGGNNSNDDPTNYVWEYNSTNNTWTQKANLPKALRSVVGFSIGDYGFIGGGNDFTYYYSNFYKYDPSSDTWTNTTSYPAGKTDGMVNFKINDEVYIGTGWLETYGRRKTFYKFK